MQRFKMKAYLVLTLCMGAFLLTGCGGDWGDSNKNTAGATLSAIAVTPADPSTPNGLTEQFTAMGTYSDGTSVDITDSVTWSSATPATATINISGLATGVAVGSSVITATSGTQSASTTLTVTAATLTSIAVTSTNPSIPNGLTAQFTATGTYSDGTLNDITASVAWTSATLGTATVDASGLATGIAPGSSDIIATYLGQSEFATLTITDAILSAIAVTPAEPSIPSGLTAQFTATGTYSDGTTNNLTASVAWTSEDDLVATLNIDGLATGIAAGSSVITATAGTQSGFTTLTVTAATLSSIAVTPIDPTIVNGLTKQFTATGTYSDSSTVDITTSAIWSSGDILVATLNPNGQVTSGLASGIGVGTALITATLDLSSADSLLTVTDPSLLPANPDAPVLGETARFVILASQAITATTAPKSAITNGDLGIMDQARSFYAGFTTGAAPGQLDELTNGLSYAHDDIDPALVPAPYASTIAFIDQTRTDLTVAYNFLAADPNPNLLAVTQVCPTELGGLTLTRGVYKTALNVTIQNGSLTLDGQGDPNSVFIFTIGGTLTTDATAGAPAGNIILIGNAQAKNVYWRTAGTTILGTGTAFSGNVFAFPQVNVLTGTSVLGRLFSVTEQVTLDANAVTKAP